MKHLCSVNELRDDEIRGLLDLAAAYAKDIRAHRDVLAGRLMVKAFFEPSTRTRLSFEAAAIRLGADVVGFSEAGSTSSTKGESLADTARILSGYGDVIVVRHPDVGSAHVMAKAASVPVINAGDGAGEHPTQALTDLVTMQQALGELAGKRLAVLGDLKYGRTVHSLVPAAKRLGMRVVQCPAPGCEGPWDDVDRISVEEALNADVAYQTRIQRERFPDVAAYEAAKGRVRIDAASVEAAGGKALILHPLPRLDELATDVDGLPTAKYFVQAKNGVPVRMAVLTSLLEHA